MEAEAKRLFRRKSVLAEKIGDLQKREQQDKSRKRSVGTPDGDAAKQ